MSPIDWADWHRAYDDPDDPLARRLKVVQAHMRAALDAAPPRPISCSSAECSVGSGFDEVAFDAPGDELWTVGSHRLAGEPARLEPGVRLWSAFRS
jgi:hypothetical protein